MQDLKTRTKQFGLEVVRLLKQLKNDHVSIPIKNQLIRCSLSVGANYRASQRAKSKRDFINKLKIVEEECDESIFFLEILQELYTEATEKIQTLIKEANILLAIIVASIRTARNNLR